MLRYLLLQADLFNVMEHIDYVSYSAGSLLNLGRQTHAAHRRSLHRVPHERFGVVESLKQHLSGGHGNLDTERRRVANDHDEENKQKNDFHYFNVSKCLRKDASSLF